MSKIKKLATGVSWGAFATVSVTCFQLVFMAIMARLLDPASFGIVAIANVCLRFFSYFAQMGTAPALIQKPILEKEDIAAALTVSVGISFIFFVLVQLSAQWFEGFYGMDGLGLVIRVLSINFVIGGFSAVSIGLMQRNTAFRALAVIDIISYVTGYGVVGLTTAYYGMEVWALVAAYMTQMMLSSVLYYAVTRFPLTFRHSSAQRRHFISYGGSYSFINFIEFLSASLDALVVGKLLGATVAGFYSRANLLANLPVQQPANILTKALFPIMSAVGNQREKQIFSLQLSSLLVGSYAFAVSIGIYMAAADIIIVLLGEKWLGAIPILKVLVCAVGPSFISHVASVTLDALGKLKTKFIIQLSALVLIALLMCWAASTGNVLNMAAALVVTEWVRVSAMVIKLTRLLRITVWEQVLILINMVIVTTCTGIMVFSVVQLLDPKFSPPFRLVAEILAGAGGLLLGFLLTRYLVVRLPAIRFLAVQSSFSTRFFPKST